MQNDTVFIEEILNLIALHTEGEYWDFKETWHENQANLLHDIICMANNLANRDAYFIVGVSDSKSKGGVRIKGVNNNGKRYDQKRLISFLKDKKFSGGMRPPVYVKTISIDGMDIDVVIIKNTTNTPYYMTEPFPCNKRQVRSGHIYTRIGDTNTDIDKMADIDKVEYLWRKRFGYDLTPFDRVKVLLNDPKNWLPMGTDGTHSNPVYNGIHYCKMQPEYTIEYKKNESKGRVDKIESDIYWLRTLQHPPHNTYIYELEIKYHSTVLFYTQAVSADNFRFERVLWKRNHLFSNKSGTGIVYAYVEKDSIEFLLDDWLCNKQETVSQTEESPVYSSLKPELQQPEYVRDNPYHVVPVFIDANEHGQFIEYIESRKDNFLDAIGDYSFNNSPHKNDNICNVVYPDWIAYLCKMGETLVDWLNDWRKNGTNPVQ